MRAFDILRPEACWKEHYSLWLEHRTRAQTFTSFESYYSRLLRGDIQILKNRFQTESLRLSENGRPRIFAQLFSPRRDSGWSLARSLGAVALARDLRDEEREAFWSEFSKRWAGERIIGPMNGHPYLGFSRPTKPGVLPGFLTSYWHADEALFFAGFEQQRRFFAFETKLDAPAVDGLNQALPPLPEGFSIERASRFPGRAAFDQLNRLVNLAFTQHNDFAPLTDEENWDLFRHLIPLMNSHSLYFLKHLDKPIGFTFGLADFNTILKNESDAMNIIRLLLKKPRRARLIYTGLLPEYLGHGLIKQIRNRQLTAWYEMGFRTFESSFVDEANVNSQKNVESTGGQLVNEFATFKLT